MKRLFLVLWAMSAGVVPLPALQWSVTNIELKTEVGQEKAVAVFPFRNVSDRPVRIVSLDSSCRCMVAEPAKEVYGPGENGEIRVEVALTGYVGRLGRSVAVETDEPGSRFAQLTLTVDIPEAVTVAPRFLFWEVGAKPSEKTVEVSLLDPRTTTVSETRCDHPGFEWHLDQGQRVGAYQLRVRPKNTEQTIDAAIRLVLTVAGRSESRVVYLSVR